MELTIFQILALSLLSSLLTVFVVGLSCYVYWLNQGHAFNQLLQAYVYPERDFYAEVVRLIGWW